MFNVLEYGAKGNGVHDDAPAINNAVSAAATSPHGGDVLIPAGVYLLGRPITLPSTAHHGAVTLRGEGGYAVTRTTPVAVTTRLRAAKSAAPFPLVRAAAGAAGYRLADLHLDGDGVGTHGFLGGGNESFLRMERVLVTGCTDTGISATMGLNEILFCYVTACGNGVDMGTDGRFLGNHVIANAGWGVRLARGGGTFVSENEIAFHGRHGLWVDGSAGTNSNHLIAGNYVENNGGWGVYLLGRADSDRTVSKCRVLGNYVSWVASRGAAGGICVRNARTVQLLGNNLIGGNGANPGELQAVLLENVDTSTVTDLVVEDCYRNPLKLVNVSSTTVRGLNARNYASAGTAADDAYGVLVGAACARVRLGGITLEDLRATRYARGVKTLSAGHTLVDYHAFGTLGDSLARGTAALRHDPALGGLVADVASIPQPGWTAPTLAGTWVDVGAPHGGAGYYKDPQGTVHLRGAVRGGRSGVLFTLPPGYRPAADVVVPAYTGASAVSPGPPAALCIPASGMVEVFGHDASFLSLDGARFRAEQ